MPLKRPDYVVWTEDGRIGELYCKVCGEQVGGQVRTLVGKRMENGIMMHDYVLEFHRFPNYVEAKIEFEDGSFHVTLGCTKCMVGSLRPQVLDEIHQADLDASDIEPGDIHRSRRARKLFGSKRGGGVR